jgi:hypothetical protein
VKSHATADVALAEKQTWRAASELYLEKTTADSLGHKEQQ